MPRYAPSLLAFAAAVLLAHGARACRRLSAVDACSEHAADETDPLALRHISD